MRLNGVIVATLCAALFAPAPAIAQLRPQPIPAPQPLPPPPQAAYTPATVPPDVLYGDEAAYGETPGRSSRGGRGLIGVRPPTLRGDRGDWTVMAGGGVVVQPRFIGSNAYDVMAIPAIAIMYRDWFFADPANGIGVRASPLRGLTVTAGADYGFGRKESDAAYLQGMGDLNGGVTTFVEAELRPLPGILQALALDVGVETPVTGDVDGVETTADVSLSVPIGAGGYASASAGVIWSDTAMMRDLFGVTPAQSAASGLPVYSPDAGIRATSFGVTAFRPVYGRWNGVALANYDRLTEEAANSPVVRDRDQYRFGLGLVYAFAGSLGAN